MRVNEERITDIWGPVLGGCSIILRSFCFTQLVRLKYITRTKLVKKRAALRRKVERRTAYAWSISFLLRKSSAEYPAMSGIEPVWEQEALIEV